MADNHLKHILIEGGGKAEAYVTPPRRGVDPKLPPRSRKGHGKKLLADLDRAAHTVVAKFLKRNLRDWGTVESVAAQPNPSPRHDECTSDQLLGALEDTDWNRTPAAGLLHVSRSTFLRWLRKYPELHRAADISIPQLRREIETCRDDLDLVAKKLGMSVMLIRRRLGHRQ